MNHFAIGDFALRMNSMFRCVVLLFITIVFVTNAVAQDSPLPLTESAKRMTLPKGFRATLFAGEPDVVQPTAFAIDDRGRLWIVESMIYPKWITDGSEGSDRIVILEDEDGDGKYDTRKVFWDKGTNLSGIALGFGGVWLTAVPNLIFVPDRDGDDKPDGKPQVLLDGWDLKSKHNVVNGLTWGPDGWLYGMNGILSNSRIGKPGTPDDKRIGIDCGVWRYHPTAHVVEWVASGSTNPWGLDFDQYGQMFITNCVIKHLFHVIPGAHYERMFGQDLTPNTYGLLESCADHIHWGGGKWTSSRGGHGIHDKPGGGHAHVGAMIYLGDNWPNEYRGNLFTCNLHGNRVNRDILHRHGSGYVAKHGSDFMMANDLWFRGLELKYGPDGGVFVTDWSDTGECHDYDEIHRENGRIYKITYGQTSHTPVNLAAMSDRALVSLHSHRNEWYVRHARRLLQERAAAGKLNGTVAATLWDGCRTWKDPKQRLRALWTLHAIGGLNEGRLSQLLTDKDEHIRAWAVRLELEDRKVSRETLATLQMLADDDPSTIVRLQLASTLQRLPLKDRWDIAEALVAHGEDATDHNIPLMIWYGIEPLVVADQTRAVQLVAKAKIPLIRRFIARRIASLAK